MMMQCSPAHTTVFTTIDEGDKCVGYLFAIKEIFQHNVRVLLQQFTDFTKAKITGVAAAHA